MQCARCRTENKVLLTDQAQPLSEASLSRQQAFATSCAISHCFLLAEQVEPLQDSWPVLPEGWTLMFTGCRFLWILPAGKPQNLTPAFLSHSPASVKTLQLVAQALSTATVTGAKAHAHLLTLAGLTAICIAHSIHSQNAAEAVPLL